MSPALSRSPLALLALIACAHAPPPEPPADTPPVATLSAPPPLPPPSACASAPPPDPPPGDGPDCSDERLARQLAGLAGASASGQRGAIYKALEGVLEVRPRALEQRELLARLLHDDKKTAEAGEAGLLLVELNEGKSALGWLLAGIAAEARGDREKARAYLARSAAIEPSGEAARRLGGASRCPAAARAPRADERLTIVKGWRGVFGEIDPSRSARDGKPPPASEAEARQRVCVDSGENEITARDVCEGKGPFRVQTGGGRLRARQAIIIPLPGGRFALHASVAGFSCRGGTSASGALRGEVIEIDERTEAPLAAARLSSCDDGPRDDDGVACVVAVSHTASFYDARSGQALLHLDEREPAERLSLSGSRLRRKGPGGCDEVIDLRNLPLEVIAAR